MGKTACLALEWFGMDVSYAGGLDSMAVYIYIASCIAYAPEMGRQTRRRSIAPPALRKTLLYGKGMRMSLTFKKFGRVSNPEFGGADLPICRFQGWTSDRNGSAVFPGPAGG